jgi:hypothetical protein
MIKSSVAMILVLTCMACDQGENPIQPLRIGDYVGTFSIRSEDGTTQAGLVILRFRAKTYSCTPERLYLPPSGAGTYRLTGNTLTLTDTTAHTAEFDWTLILNGDFAYFNDGHKITLTQDDTKYRRYRSIELTLDG